MTKKADALQAALASSGGRKPVVETLPAPTAESLANGTGRAPSREGKINISAYLDPGYKRSLRMVQAVTDKKLEPLLAEALNDLFAKYDVPQVRAD